jgi:futalosine hydrolase
MKLLVVAATEAEVALFRSRMPACAHVLITGVGPIATTWAVTNHLATNQYDLVIQAGVAGTFHHHLLLGTLVWVVADTYGDLGAEDHDNYLSIYDLGLQQPDEAPHKGGMLPAPTEGVPVPAGMPQTTGITVSTVTGCDATVARRAAMGHGTESMEGAAFHYACLKAGVPFMQVRALSNYVTPRDRSSWKMKEAIIALNDWLIAYTTALCG